MNEDKPLVIHTIECRILTKCELDTWYYYFVVHDNLIEQLVRSLSIPSHLFEGGKEHD